MRSSVSGEVVWVRRNYCSLHHPAAKKPKQGARRGAAHALRQIDLESGTALCRTCGPVKLQVYVSARGEAPRCANVLLPNKAYRRHLKSACERCGWQPEHRCQLEVHHVNGNHDDNAPENLRTLCANCHRLAHMVPSAYRTEAKREPHAVVLHIIK